MSPRRLTTAGRSNRAELRAARGLCPWAPYQRGACFVFSLGFLSFAWWFWVGRCYGCVVSCEFVFGVFVSMYFVPCFVGFSCCSWAIIGR